MLGWIVWNAYMEAPWTRDGMVRVYVVTKAAEVAGGIVELPVAANQAQLTYAQAARVFAR